MLECAPDLADKYNFLMKVTRKCLECEKVNETQELNGLTDLNYMNYDTQIRTLHDALQEYYQRRSNVLMMCACKNAHFEHLRGVKGHLVPVYNTNHEEIWDVVKCPLVLLVKVKGRYRPRNNIKISDKFPINDVAYVFKSGMLFTETGERGHWRCMLNANGKLDVYNDDLLPAIGTQRDLMNNGADLIFVAENLLQSDMNRLDVAMDDRINNDGSKKVKEEKNAAISTEMLPMEVPIGIINVQNQVNVKKEIRDILQCKECDYSTPKQSNLKCHINSKHPVDVDTKFQNPNISKNSCGSNDVNFKTESTEHYKDLKTNNFQCDFYEKSYMQKCHLNRHIRADHDKMSYTCRQCGLIFSRTDTLSRHIKEVHLSDD